MAATVSSAALTTAIAAANAAGAGVKDAAYVDSLISTIGSAYKRVLRRNGTTVWTGTAAGSLTRTGTQMIVEAITANASASGDINSGTWTHRIEKGSDSAVYIESAVGPSGSGVAGILSASLVSGESATCSAATINAPGFDSDTSDVDLMVNHMRANLYPLPGANDIDPLKGGNIVVGADLRSVAVPTWWPGNNFASSRTYWTLLLPWYVIWDKAGNPLTSNTRLAVRNMKLYSLEDGDVAWNLLSTTVTPRGDSFLRSYTGTASSEVSTRLESDSGWSVKIVPNGRIYHGYDGQVNDSSFDPATLKGLHVSIEARKVLDDSGGTDDRSSNGYFVQVGIDAYPYPGATQEDAGATYWPGVGGSAFIEITATSSYQKVYFSNIESPPTRNADTSVSRPRQVLTEAAFRALPPPA